jgi:nitrogen permease regulator 3-like protein
MAVPVLPNPSNFLGVALVINRSRDGPRFVFHYPPHILHPSTRLAGRSDGDELEDDDVLLDRLISPSATSSLLPKGVDPSRWNHDDHVETDSGSQVVPWEHVGGYPTKDLASLLTPARAYHKSPFQVSLDQLHFVTRPVYVPENGLWKKTKKSKERQPRSRVISSGVLTEGASGEGADADADADTNADAEADADDRVDGSAVLAGDVPQIETRDMAEEAVGGLDEAATAEEKKSGMTMFNLVFILNPRKHEAKELVDTLYFHILRKINKAYKYAQQRSDFVWQESKRILQLKDKGREEKTRMSTLWPEILDASSLAASVQDIYEAVSQNKIAALQLDTAGGTVTHSVQIPIPFCLPDLPPESDPDPETGERFRGLWITTANSLDDSDRADDAAFLDKSFALLLLHDESKIVAELQADPDETTAAMIEFVQLSKPTTSFHAISQVSPLSPAQVRKYAQHFIFWRRAIAIPPLHGRDVYIMSPNADTASLPRASQAWAKAFHVAPPLPNFLADLSAAPRPYKKFIPSKTHRPQYMEMLAWLMRGGWVTQLCTFAYVVVWPEIQYEVEYQLEADELKQAAADAEGGDPAAAAAAAAAAASTTATRDDDGPADTLPPQEQQEQQDERDSVFGSPVLSSLPSSPSVSSPSQPSFSPLDLAGPQTANEGLAEQARLHRLADRAARLLAEKSALHARKPAPAQSPHPSLATNPPHLSHLTPYVILDASQATGRESLYLSAIGRRFEDPKVRSSWPVFWKYLNGRSALERIALLEDMKRKEAWALLTGMSEYLVCVRHW